MQIKSEPRGKYLLLHAAGRLDASWAEYFQDTLLSYIRHGQHHLVIDASGMSFLSSAGIRSLVRIHKELKSVHGNMSIINATDFVSKTLETTGLGFWLAGSPPDGMPTTEALSGHNMEHDFEAFVLSAGAKLLLSAPSAWRPWQKVDPGQTSHLFFDEKQVGLGIGSAATRFEEARARFGEFMAVTGNVIFQPPGATERPDYLLSEKEFVPEMLAIQAIMCTGDMSLLLRFAPTREQAFYPVSTIMEAALRHTCSNAAGFVILAEVEGLVGVTMIRSPGLLEQDRPVEHPAILDWLSFTGDRVYAGQQTLIVGITAYAERMKASSLLPPIPSRPDICGHAHACVFPYQPLQNGKIDLKTTLNKFMDGPPPIALMHLTDDNRPAIGIGQTALIRGACWCAPIANPEELP